jgi:hypothetical protein
MMSGGRKSEKIYVGREVLLMPHPDSPRFYYKGHISIAFVSCPYCGAPRMKPCIRNDGSVAASDGHASRRKRFSEMKRTGLKKLSKKVNPSLVLVFEARGLRGVGVSK